MPQSVMVAVCTLLCTSQHSDGSKVVPASPTMCGVSALCAVTFRKPVAVGDLLRFQSHVLEASALHDQQQQGQQQHDVRVEQAARATPRSEADAACDQVSWAPLNWPVTYPWG